MKPGVEDCKEPAAGPSTCIVMYYILVPWLICTAEVYRPMLLFAIGQKTSFLLYYYIVGFSVDHPDY
jgi:hypothetical protein